MHPILNTCWIEDILPLHRQYNNKTLSLADYKTKLIEMLDTFYQSPHHSSNDAVRVIASVIVNYRDLVAKYE